MRNDAHEHGDVRVPEYALHHDLVLDLVQQLVRRPWVKDLFDGHGRAIELTHVDGREAALSDLLADLNVIDGYLPHAWNSRQAACVDRDAGRGVREGLEILLLDLVLQIINLLDQLILLLSLLLQLLLDFSDPRILRARRHRSLGHGHPASCASSPTASAKGRHPIPIVIRDCRVLFLHLQVVLVMLLL